MHYKGKAILNLMKKSVFNYFPRIVYTTDEAAKKRTKTPTTF
jgi:hypothetical protein